LFADDLKIYHPVRRPSDCDELQKNLDTLAAYCEKNRLFLNAQKCTVTKFTRNTVNYVNYDYKIGSVSLEKSSLAKDLGVLYDEKLTFNEHINVIYNKGLRLLGFIFRACADFKNPYTLLNLFNSLIRSRLEYCSSVWSPHYIKYKKIVEKLQRKLVKFMFHKKLIVTTSDEFNYLDCCKILKIDTLEKRRIRQDLKFLVRSLKNEIDTQTYIHNLNFFVKITLMIAKIDLRKTTKFR
jgi:hypothetical protein